ncbi:LCP family protein [Microbacterium sp. CIAB417]|uniref:LCP family protein n=1 Tax=Microbacterium sp. CIAB417 TaxID=2860287 RepID=UPI001FADF4C1|nr:LCP family protein [Microbacterium sp. CIAB417]
MSDKTPLRRTVARHGQLRSPGPVSQLLKIIGIVLAVVLVSGVGVAAYVGTTLLNTVAENSVDLEGQESVPPDIGAYKGGFNMLLVGVDACEPEYAEMFGKRCEDRDGDATLNDTNLLVHVSDAPRRVTVVSIPRDTMLAIPSCTDEEGNTHSAMSKQPLNSAWEYGGLNCVAQTVTELTGQDIQYAASVTWGGVIEITNAIGGVEVCLASGIKDKATGLDMEAGNHTIQGYEALQFLRTRKGVGDGSDLGRIGNQQQYMSSLARKMLSSEVLGDVGTMLKLADTAVNNLTTSSTLTPMTIAQIALALKDVPTSDIVFVQYPTATDPDDANKVVPSWEAAGELFAAIEANQPLEITHENNENEGVVVEEAPTTEEPVEPVEPTETATPAPDASETAVALPDSIKGNSAAQQTCSNGNVKD